MRYCLDSNVIIDMFRGETAIKAKLESMEHYCITPVVLCELFKGAYAAQGKDEAIKLVEAFLHSAELLEFNEHACRLFGQRYASLKQKGKTTQESDLMIACTALSHNCILVTRNTKDFVNVQGLRVISV
ncbi:type II toxin-antitoxin system VapC family toxin [Candidatus Woesearchaeota archaeon]|nr:type II toxin-antitoxin system VapC family toxin [Candidatus Woesearchaeota archaeon]